MVVDFKKERRKPMNKLTIKMTRRQYKEIKEWLKGQGIFVDKDDCNPGLF